MFGRPSDATASVRRSLTESCWWASALVVAALTVEARRVHEHTHLSDRQIATATGAKPSTVRDWLTGRSVPSGTRAERLVELVEMADRLSRVEATGLVLAIVLGLLWLADRAGRSRDRPTFVPREWVTEFHAAPPPREPDSSVRATRLGPPAAPRCPSTGRARAVLRAARVALAGPRSGRSAHSCPDHRPDTLYIEGYVEEAGIAPSN
jgi:DNA-binding transcriptional regulator YiaG